MIAIDAGSLTVRGAWQIPLADTIGDGDWGTTPTLFSDAMGRRLVAAVDKNGYLYAYDRSRIAAGPIWRRHVAQSGDADEQGDGSVSSGAFGGGRLFASGGNTVIGGKPFAGFVRAVEPATGRFLWEHGAPGVVFAPILYANGLVIDAAGSHIEVLSAASGARLATYGIASGAPVYGLSMANGRIYAGATDGNIYAVGVRPRALGATATPTPAPAPSCPPHWACHEIGGSAPPLADSVSGGIYTIAAAGEGLAGHTDRFHFLSRTISGDTEIGARIARVDGVGPAGRAGIIVRGSGDPGSPYYAALLGERTGPVVRYRAAAGGPTTIAATGPGGTGIPHYVKIQRRGDDFVAATSDDGVSYTLIAGSAATVVMASSALAGLAAASGQAAGPGTAVFDDVRVGGLSGPPSTPTPIPDRTCPAGWRCGDIGNFVPAGGEHLDGDTWTLHGAGQVSGGAADQIHFVWQVASGDVVAVARIVDQSARTDDGRAGVMFRASTDPSSPFYAAYVQPGGSVLVQYRRARLTFTRSAAEPLPVRFVRVERSGNVLTTDTSLDGLSWARLATGYAEVELGTEFLAGLAVSSGTAGVENSAHVDHVSVQHLLLPPTPTPTPLAVMMGRVSSDPPVVDLSTEGSDDWAHWGLHGAGAFDHKAAVTPAISDVAPIGHATIAAYSGTVSATWIWDDGTPTARARTKTGIYVNGVGHGFQLTLPADATTRRLRLYVGVSRARGRLRATLSDHSAVDFATRALDNPATSTLRVVTIDYRAAEPGQRLTITWVLDGDHARGRGNISLQAVSLSRAELP